MLKTETFGKYTVSQIGPLEGTRLRLFRKQLEALQVDEITRESLEEWATLAACTTPFISREEYLGTPVVELQPLMDALQRVNAADESAPVSKKKQSRPTKRSTGAL